MTPGNQVPAGSIPLYQVVPACCGNFAETKDLAIFIPD